MEEQTPSTHILGLTYCGTCRNQAQDVDVYYLPDPDADTSYLDIVGSSVNPLLYDATRSIITSDHALPGSPFTG